MNPDDFEHPIQHQFDILMPGHSLKIKSQSKRLELVKSKAEFEDSILNGFIPFKHKIETFLK